MGTFASSGAIIAKAGANVSTALTDSIIEQWIDEATATCCVFSRYDWVANSGAITASALPIIEGTISALAAIEAINYDMDTYGRETAKAMINVLRDEALRGLQLIRDQKGVTFIK